MTEEPRGVGWAIFDAVRRLTITLRSAEQRVRLKEGKWCAGGGVLDARTRNGFSGTWTGSVTCRTDS